MSSRDAEFTKWIEQPNHHVYKDGRRSYVARILVDGHDLIAKQPRNKNKRLWMRLSTLWRKSEVVKHFDGLLLLKELGIPCSEPYLAIEQRRWGMVVDSWFFYEHRNGKSLEVDQLDEIVTKMEIIHSNKLLHDDPHIDNFLISPAKEVFLIDCAPKKNLLGALGITHNWLLLVRRFPEPNKLRAVLNDSHISPTLARLSNSIHALRRARHGIRKKLRSK